MWNVLVCTVLDHRWHDFEQYNADVLFLEEHWRECQRCEKYENLMERP